MVARWPALYSMWKLDEEKAEYYCLHCWASALYGNCAHIVQVMHHRRAIDITALPQASQRGAPKKSVAKKLAGLLGNRPKKSRRNNSKSPPKPTKQQQTLPVKKTAKRHSM